MSKKNVSIDSEKLFSAISKAGLTATEVCKLCGKCATYLHTCLKRGSMNEDDLNRICAEYGIKKSDVIKKEEEETTEPSNSIVLLETINRHFTLLKKCFADSHSSICGYLQKILDIEKDNQETLKKLERTLDLTKLRID